MELNWSLFHHVTIKFTIQTSNNIPNILFFFFLFFSSIKEGKAKVGKAVQKIPKSMLLPQCITISSNNRTARNRKSCAENICPAYVADGFETQKCSCCQKEELTASSDDVLFSNLMLWFKVLYYKGGEGGKIQVITTGKSPPVLTLYAYFDLL